MKLFLYFSLTIIFIGSVKGFAPRELTLQKKSLTIYTPHIINPKYFAFEIGYVTDKRFEFINYSYNAFAKAFAAEEFYTTDTVLRAGALGAKAGVFLPTQPWFPIYLEMAFGYAKTSLHIDPWLGDRDNSVQTKSLLLAEGGVMYCHKKNFLVRVTYQVNNLKYFTKKIFFSIGFNY
jgi:hypothetical protein